MLALASGGFSFSLLLFTFVSVCCHWHPAVFLLLCECFFVLALASGGFFQVNMLLLSRLFNCWMLSRRNIYLLLNIDVFDNFEPFKMLDVVESFRLTPVIGIRRMHDLFYQRDAHRTDLPQPGKVVRCAGPVRIAKTMNSFINVRQT